MFDKIKEYVSETEASQIIITLVIICIILIILYLIGFMNIPTIILGSISGIVLGHFMVIRKNEI